MGNKGEIFLVPNGVDLDVFKKTLSDEDKKILKQELNIAEDETVIVTTSRLALKNGIDDLIKAMNFLIYKSGIKSKLLIFGSGPDELKLKTLAVEQRVGEQVIFMVYMDYKKLPPYVYLSKNRYVWRPYENGQLGKEQRLCSVDATTAEEDACKMEHAVSPVTLERFVMFMEFTESCPRGGSDWLQNFDEYIKHGRNENKCLKRMKDFERQYSTEIRKLENKVK